MEYLGTVPGGGISGCRSLGWERAWYVGRTARGPLWSEWVGGEGMGGPQWETEAGPRGLAYDPQMFVLIVSMEAGTDLCF